MLLCDAKHLKSRKIWGPLVPAKQCENKLISPTFGCWWVLCMCSTKFDIGIWSSTLPNLVPMVQHLFVRVEGLNTLFVWGNEKCECTHIKHPLNRNYDLVMKNMQKMWDEVSPRYRSLGPHNTLLINDYPFKCIGNMPSCYILALPFN
jgi:hypothetical protein